MCQCKNGGLIACGKTGNIDSRFPWSLVLLTKTPCSNPKLSYLAKIRSGGAGPSLAHRLRKYRPRPEVEENPGQVSIWLMMFSPVCGVHGLWQRLFGCFRVSMNCTVGDL
ncbi:hypothetical protein RRG08_029732 [Elysia crispata]|uniref:Uncharacterized protein n=1 Tax=Elysia crispata TaxID=231223 RepID=A0AAE1DGB7_9GAST|nr:hypothetical protein RRG08_029732 [Elysia crispata]